MTNSRSDSEAAGRYLCSEDHGSEGGPTRIWVPSFILAVDCVSLRAEYSERRKSHFQGVCVDYVGSVLGEIGSVKNILFEKARSFI